MCCKRFWLAMAMIGGVMAPYVMGGERLARERIERAEEVSPTIKRLRTERKLANERGNASEYAGAWRMKLPAGFEYDVKLTQRDDGLLRLECPGHALNLLGDFVCIGNELRLVKPRMERVDDYVWVYRDGKFELTVDEQGHGGHYRGAWLTRQR
jgi:hypothetical protein